MTRTISDAPVRIGLLLRDPAVIEDLRAWGEEGRRRRILAAGVEDTQRTCECCWASYRGPVECPACGEFEGVAD